MYKNTTYILIYLMFLLLGACSKGTTESEPTPNSTTYINQSKASESLTYDTNVEKNIDEIIEDLHLEIKRLKSQLDYQNESFGKIEAQSQLWANPFSVYNKEIVLDNGSSIFGKIIYQDKDVMKVETLIGQLIINRDTIVRVVNQISAYSNFNKDDSEVSFNEESGINLIQKRAKSESAKLVLIGDITENKDASGNTVLRGEIKNVGNKRADFAKIIFSFRTNWQGDTKTLTAFINGVTNTFDTGISSDNSILPHAVGSFELIIPVAFGPFIGYNYDIDWSQYDG